ncbi:MAG TPA: SPOR domain-containing protein [Gemmatimonadales bacterium]|nr:SPOR domain-containing protein [Gemmatimonadales bacterium]
MTVGRLDGWTVGLLAVLAISPTFRLSAQSDARLAEALRLAQTGQADSGRAIVRRLLTRLSPSDSLYPEALLTAAKIAPDAQTVSSNLNRIVLDYGSSPWADDALLLLTQLHFAQRDAAQTIQVAERLSRDYPDSPFRARASFFGARAYFELKNEMRGCELIQQALDGAGDDVEFKNQVTFYAARCNGPAPTAASPPPPGGDTARTVQRLYAVQVLAVKSAAQVDEMLTRLKVMGFQDARVVRDSTGFFKVRVGRYASRDEAQRVQQRLKTRVGGNPFVVDEP